MGSETIFESLILKVKSRFNRFNCIELTCRRSIRIIAVRFDCKAQGCYSLFRRHGRCKARLLSTCYRKHGLRWVDFFAR